MKNYLREYILTFFIPISNIASLLMSSGVNVSYAILLFFSGDAFIYSVNSYSLAAERLQPQCDTALLS